MENGSGMIIRRLITQIGNPVKFIGVEAGALTHFKLLSGKKYPDDGSSRVNAILLLSVLRKSCNRRGASTIEKRPSEKQKKKQTKIK